MSFQLPSLPYAYDALEPFLDQTTMEIHHSRHHQTYINNLNQAIAGTEYEHLTVTQLLEKIASMPTQLQSAIRNQGGGHANHSLFWTILSPHGGGEPDGSLAQAILRDLDGFESFKQAFTKAAISQFGSGWAWLSVTQEGKLIVESSANQDSPLMHGHIPVLGLDVWEHAYYLKYQNKRADYIQAVFSVFHWPEVQRRYDEALQNLQSPV